MIYVKLIGHDFKYEIRELIKAFFFGEEIIFISNNKEYNGDGLLINSLNIKGNKIDSITKIYKNHKLMFQYNEEDLQNIEIGQEDLKKKIRIGLKFV